MMVFRVSYPAIAIALAALLAGCGTPREMTAPCKRPVNLMSYGAEISRPDCGPMAVVNTDPAAALAAIGAVATSSASE